MNNKHEGSTLSNVEGFTLIELMIVIVIMGLLTTIGIFAFMSSQQKGRDSRRKSDLANIAKALEMYSNDRSSYPTASSGKIAGCGTDYATACEWGDKFGNTSVSYMVKLPKDPASTTQKYYYERSGSGYRLYAKLENNQDADIPTTGQKYYSVDCSAMGTTLNCNFVTTSANVVLPTPVP